MIESTRSPTLAVMLALLLACGSQTFVYGVEKQRGLRDGEPPQRPLDVIYVPTPPEVVSKMLSMASVGPGDIVYDLGSGDGRIVIAAVKEFGAARGIGIELDPTRIAEARVNADAAGVADRVTFVTQDLFEADLSDATVVAMYLLPGMLQRLQPMLRQMKPGVRIVSHNYDMGAGWQPQQTVRVGNSLVHLWRVRRR